MLPLLAQQVGPGDDACGENPGAACTWVFDRTDSEVLARAADWLIARPFKIALILILAFIGVRALNRVIRKFVDGVERASVRRDLGDPGDVTSLLAAGPLGERSRQRAQTLAAVLKSLGRAAILTVAGLTILGEFEINLGPLLAGAGIVGVAVGFGAQTLVRDFLSGVFMILEDQFGVGDYIDAGPASGQVEGLSLRTTRIRDVEGTVWHIPNGEIKRIGNFSQEWSRALLDIQVAHGTELTRAEAVIKGVADAMWRSEEWKAAVLEEPEVWGVEGVAATGITIRLVLKTRPADQWRVLRALRLNIIQAFEQAGIEVPVVQTVLAPPAQGV